MSQNETSAKKPALHQVVEAFVSNITGKRKDPETAQCVASLHVVALEA